MHRARFLDLGREDACTFVAGTGRSGTTWIAQTLANMTGSRQIFEPCLLDHSYEFATLKGQILEESRALHNHQLYIPPELAEASSYFRPLKRLLRGRVRNDWCDRYTHSGVYSRRVIKEIRANLFLAYLTRTWPNVKVIWVVRDIFNTINSQLVMAEEGWHFDWDYRPILSQQRLVDEWLAAYLPSMRMAATAVERLAHKWCIETMVPYWQGVQEGHNVRLVFYEQLVGDIATWGPISQFVSNASWSKAKLAERLSRPSSTSRILLGNSGSCGSDLDQLSVDDITAIRRIVAIYGAERFSDSTYRSDQTEVVPRPATGG